VIARLIEAAPPGLREVAVANFSLGKVGVQRLLDAAARDTPLTLLNLGSLRPALRAMVSAWKAAHPLRAKVVDPNDP
jgi:hypothetical protein